jgi:hypothetical protein
MTTLVQIPEDFKSEFKVDLKGEITASIRGTARLADIDESSIRKSFKLGAGQKPNSLAKYLIEYGFDGAYLDSWIDNGIPGIAVNSILEYYAYECQPRYRKEQAKVLCRAFRNYGYQKWFQQQLGWQPETKPERALTPAEQLVKQANLLLEHEQKLQKHDEEIDHLGNLYNLVAHNINVTNQSRLDVFIQVQESELLANEDPSPVPLRKIIWKLVNKFCLAANCLPEEAWNHFYRELKDRYGFDAKARRKNQGLKFALDAVEQEPEMLENLHKVVSAEFRRLDLPRPRIVDDLRNLNYIEKKKEVVSLDSKDVQKEVDAGNQIYQDQETGKLYTIASS